MIDPLAASDEAPISDREAAEARLGDAAERGVVTELVLVLRGTVHRLRGPGGMNGLWRVQLRDGHHRIVSAESVIAITPIRGGRRSSAPKDPVIDQ